MEIAATDLLQAEGITVEDGTWRKQAGAADFDVAGISGAPKIIGLLDWRPTSTVQRILAAGLDGKLYKEVAGDLDSVLLKSGLSATARPGSWIEGGAEIAGNNRKAFYFNGADIVQVLSGDGITTSNIALPPADWAAANQPIHGVVHRDSLWGYGNLNDPHRAYKSLGTNHENFTGTPFSLSIFPGVGERLAYGTSFKTLLFFLKYPRGIFWLDDSDPSTANWHLNKLTDAVGPGGPGCVVNMEDDILFLSADGRFHLVSLIDPTSGSIQASDLNELLQIDAWVRANVNIDRIDQTVSVWHARKKKALFGLPRVGSTENDLIVELDFSRRALVTGRPVVSYSYRDAALSLATRLDNRTRIPIHGDSAGHVFKMDQASRTKAGTGYIGIYQIPHTNFGFVDQGLITKMKNFDWLELVVAPTGPHFMVVDIIIDGRFSESLLFDMGGGSNVIGSFMIGTDSLGGDFVTNRRRLIRGSGVWWSAQLSNTFNNQDFSIINHLVGFRPGAEGPRL